MWFKLSSATTEWAANGGSSPERGGGVGDEPKPWMRPATTMITPMTPDDSKYCAPERWRGENISRKFSFKLALSEVMQKKCVKNDTKIYVGNYGGDNFVIKKLGIKKFAKNTSEMYVVRPGV